MDTKRGSSFLRCACAPPNHRPISTSSFFHDAKTQKRPRSASSAVHMRPGTLSRDRMSFFTAVFSAPGAPMRSQRWSKSPSIVLTGFGARAPRGPPSGGATGGVAPASVVTASAPMRKAMISAPWRPASGWLNFATVYLASGSHVPFLPTVSTGTAFHSRGRRKENL